jgi:hypothetical protein
MLRQAKPALVLKQRMATHRQSQEDIIRHHKTVVTLDLMIHNHNTRMKMMKQ